jgi:1,2-diacylglycerol 3-alpha-glucosyltransferase
MKKVIGQFNDSFAPIADGVCNVVRNYAYWLQKKYGDCYVVTPEFPGYVDNEDFSVLRYHSVPVPLRNPYRAGMAFSDITFLKEIYGIKFDIIHAHSPFSSGRLGLRLARRLNVPIVATFHSKYYDDFKSALKSVPAAKMVIRNIVEFYNKVDCVWTVSNTAVDTIREYGYKGCIDVVGNGSDIVCEAFPDRTYGCEDKIRFLYVGQHIWHKNLKIMIFALKKLKDSGLRFNMTMVGEGVNQQGVKKLIQRLGMSEDFKFTGRINDRERLKAIYLQADLNLFPSVYDTFSLVVREAAALGCPSLVIAGSCAAEGIEDGCNGFISQNDADSFASNIQKAVSDTELLKAAGRSARNTLYRSWESVVDEVAQKYCDIIESKKRNIR